MQDFHKIVDKYINSNNKGYFSIFDGHGKGVIEPIKYAASRLPSIFSNFLISTHYNVEKSFIYSFQKIDDELKCYSQIENCGSTASLLYIDKEVGIVYSANVGDSKGILINKFKKYKILTTEHKCLNNNEEVQRIKNLGGLIFNGRLFGQLALTRALGDFSLKNNGLISTPSIYKNKILEDDIYIVVASDGVWDTLNEDEVSNICIDNANLNTDDLGKLIIKRAIEKGSEDNISCILIQVGNL
jgi:serine/threonine protein phosphatase PrpC